MRIIDFKDLTSMAGQEIGVSDWVEIDQARVNRFADATGDHQWIHVDVERATREIGGTILHGDLTLSLIPWLGSMVIKVEGVARAINYGYDKVRFTNMVRVGKRVRLRVKVAAADRRAGGVMVKFLSTVEIEGETKAACTAEKISIYYGE